MSEQLGRMLTAIPVSVRENVKTDCVYLGSGVVVAGRERPDVTVRVYLSEKGTKLAMVSSKEAKFTLSAPFDTEAEQEAFPALVQKVIVSRMN